jgi:hypothetical protein
VLFPKCERARFAMHLDAAMFSRKSVLLILVMVAVAGLAGCGSIPMASTEDDIRAKSFAVNPEKAVIYVYRPESLGFAVPMTVKLDGREGGRTVGQTYFVWEVDPGPHEIASYAEDVVTVKLDTRPGENYYVWQEVKIGVWVARSLLHQVDEEAGRQGVSECRLGKSNI